jgi:hypothetical protein
MSLSSLANDPELQKFVAAKELENQLTAQVKFYFVFKLNQNLFVYLGSSFNKYMF